jgi:integrase
LSKRKTRKDGRVEMKITIGRDINGKPIRKAFYGATERECKAKIKAYWQGEYKPTYSDITLAEWADKWLEIKKGKVKESTYESTYRNAVDVHIKPYFKNARLKDIKPIDIEKFFRAKAHMSASSLSKMRITLGSMFESAVDNELISRNPVKPVKPVSKQKKAEKRAYTMEEARQLIEFCKTHADGLHAIMLLKTGLRIGEMLALQWSDVDFKNMTITVSKAVTRLASGREISSAKTDASNDTIPFDDELKELLWPRRGVGWVFSDKGTYFDYTVWLQRVYNKLMRDYKAWCEEKNKPCRILTPHELRHTYGSLIYNATRDIYITSKLMRHSNISTTSKVYVHEDIGTKRDAIAAAFSQKTEDILTTKQRHE